MVIKRYKLRNDLCSLTNYKLNQMEKTFKPKVKEKTKLKHLENPN